MMTKASYFVVGGEYTDTRFEHLVDHQPEERYGPFAHYKEAREIWAQHAWRTVDNCHARYRITDGNGALVDDPPADHSDLEDSA